MAESSVGSNHHWLSTESALRLRDYKGSEAPGWSVGANLSANAGVGDLSKMEAPLMEGWHGPTGDSTSLAAKCWDKSMANPLVFLKSFPWTKPWLHLFVRNSLNFAVKGLPLRPRSRFETAVALKVIGKPRWNGEAIGFGHQSLQLPVPLMKTICHIGKLT